jgi:hypothetical protein
MTDAELSARLQRAIARAAMAECKAAGLVCISFNVFADALMTTLTLAAAELELFDNPAQVEAFAAGIGVRVRRYVPEGRQRKIAGKPAVASIN